MSDHPNLPVCRCGVFTAVEAAIAADREDAARYRWLVKNSDNSQTYHEANGFSTLTITCDCNGKLPDTRGKLDGLIDAAMKEENHVPLDH